MAVLHWVIHSTALVDGVTMVPAIITVFTRYSPACTFTASWQRCHLYHIRGWAVRTLLRKSHCAVLVALKAGEEDMLYCISRGSVLLHDGGQAGASHAHDGGGDVRCNVQHMLSLMYKCSDTVHTM